MNTPASDSAGSTTHAQQDPAVKLGFTPGLVVQQFGWDDDCTQEFSDAIEQAIGAQMENEDYADVSGAVLLWFREGDGDLTDTLVDLVGYLDDGGFVVLLTPRHGEGVIDEPDIEEASTTAGMHIGGAHSISDEWRMHKLVPRRDQPKH